MYNEKVNEHKLHAHDWIDGEKVRFGRKMNAWEKRRVDAVPKRIVEKGGVSMWGEDPHFKTMKQFVAVLKGGGEIDFDWKGLDISVLMFRDDEIHVNDSPERNFHFKSLDEALDGYIIPGTDKSLREGLFELEIVGVPVWADEDGNPA